MPIAVQAFYDRWTRPSDPVASAPPVARWRRRAITQLDLRGGDTVVDAGCRSSANLPLLRDAVGPTGAVVGVDIAPGMLARADRRVRRAGWRNVHVVRADGTVPPLGADALEGDHPASPLVNPALDAFVSLTAPTRPLRERLAWTLAGDPLASLTADVEAGHGRIEALTDATRSHAAGGYVRTTTGTVPTRRA